MLVALGAKIYGAEQDRIKTANNLLHAHDNLNHTYQQMSKVFFPHQLIGIRAGIPVEETMPIGIENACIISLKIHHPQTVRHELFHQHVENFLDHCRLMLMQGYDETSMKSTGYLIRADDNSMLCSVGYPFQELGASKSESALALVETMAAAFYNTMDECRFPHQVHCSIGISLGPVSSKFSRSGRIRDQLSGDVIQTAIATHTASFLINPEPTDLSSIVMISTEVYNSLPAETRQGFLQVQDDRIDANRSTTAANLHYRVIEQPKSEEKLNSQFAS